jgi:micrococcal nuclease
MGVLLMLLGLGGVVVAVVALVRPVGWLGLGTGSSAGWLLGASLLIVVTGGALVSNGAADEVAMTTSLPAAGPGSSTAETTVPDQTTTFTTGIVTTTTEAAATTTASVRDSVFRPPADGPSGDPFAPLDPSAEPVTVVSITDGDTIDVRLESGAVDTVRLIGVNTPESGECWGEEAGRVLEALIPVGTTIGMTVDVSDRDQFDRLLRYLWLGEMSVNEEMVRRGAAISRRYEPDTALAVRFESAKEDAQSEQLGLWAPEACGPAADADLQIIDVVYDAAGDDSQNLNGEYVTIANAGDNVVDLTGWGIKDESASNRYEFPTGAALAPGETLAVFSGCGEDSETVLYWCASGSAIWNNDGDTVFLTDPSGNTHDSFSYTPAPTVTVAGPGGGDCDPAYPEVCIPPYPPDLDCGDVAHRRFQVTGLDRHGFDGDGDGLGCES